MEFRRSGQRDERRRRVLMDEMRQPGETAVVGEATPRPARTPGYADAARDAAQPPLTSLIPQRAWSCVVALLLGLAAVAAIQSLYSASWYRLPAARQAALRGLDVSEPGSLAGWIGAVCLALAAGYSLLIYHLRRHKIDDYRGRYRAWMWCAPLLLLASLDAVTTLHSAAGDTLLQLTGQRLTGTSSSWGLALVAVVYSLLGLRMLVEMWRCRGAVLLLAGVAVACPLAAGFHFQLLRLDGGLLDAMIQSTSLLLAQLAVAACSVWYARYVYLEAHGRLPAPRARRARSAAKPKQGGSDEKAPAAGAGAAMPQVKRKPTLRVDDAHKSPRGNAASDSTPQQDTEDESEGERISKAERRRLRKQSRRQQREPN